MGATPQGYWRDEPGFLPFECESSVCTNPLDSSTLEWMQNVNTSLFLVTTEKKQKQTHNMSV